MNMNVVYVAIWGDRHSDVSVRVFSSAELAVEWAKNEVREMDRFGDLDEKMTEGMQKAGWLYYGRYSCEGDCIRVVSCVVDAAVG